MDLVHELCPVQLLEVTKKSDNLSGWLASIQHLAHMQILVLQRKAQSKQRYTMSSQTQSILSAQSYLDESWPIIKMKTTSPTEITIYQADINIFNPEIKWKLVFLFWDLTHPYQPIDNNSSILCLEDERYQKEEILDLRQWYSQFNTSGSLYKRWHNWSLSVRSPPKRKQQPLYSYTRDSSPAHSSPPAAWSPSASRRTSRADSGPPPGSWRCCPGPC